MAEYPTRSCGPCPHLARFERTEKNDYISQNTTPEPNMELCKHTDFNEYNLGVPGTTLSPNLRASPTNQIHFDKDKQRYLGGIPPCTQKKTVPTCQDSITRHPHSESPTSNQNSDHHNSKTNSNSVKPVKGILKSENPSIMHTNAVRNHPSVVHPSTKPPVPNELRPVPQEPTQPFCYLPQPQDSLPHPNENNMGPYGPWATGKVDWGPLSGLTGTRPVVDKYSIARYSEGDWRAHNKDMLEMSGTELHRANLIDWNGRQCLEQTQADVDKQQEDNTKRLNQRELETHRWKCELERAIAAAAEEIHFIEEQRRRLKQASSVLMIPESIAGECLDRRTSRIDAELVRDEVEEELIKELALCSEIRDIFSRTLRDIEKQLLEDKTVKQRLEYDWSDKKVAHEIDTLNMSLNNRSTVLMFKPGAVYFPDEQSSPEYWEHFTRESLLEGEATRQRSVALRGTLDAILNNAARDLRTQADKVELCLSKRISCTLEVTTKLQNELKAILRSLADVEVLINDLKNTIRRMDTPMKKSQTRLSNRLERPRVENCRDQPHFGLVEEVKSIGENVSALQAQLNQAETSQANLTKVRSDLEREIMMKLKSLEIDNNRLKFLRDHYPSSTALSGY